MTKRKRPHGPKSMAEETVTVTSFGRGKRGRLTMAVSSVEQVPPEPNPNDMAEASSSTASYAPFIETCSMNQLDDNTLQFSAASDFAPTNEHYIPAPSETRRRGIAVRRAFFEHTARTDVNSERYGGLGASPR